MYMKYLVRLFNVIIISAMANCLIFINGANKTFPILLLSLLTVIINIFPSFYNRRVPTLRLRICADGCELLIIFLFSAVISTIYHIVLAFIILPDNWTTFIASLLIAVCVEAVVFWNGIIRVYCTSIQLGIKRRVVGIILGWIPIANICALCSIIHIVSCEVKFDSDKININNKRKDMKICHTKYPILLVHGVFFRDSKLLNYWGRIPAELQKNGAVIYYGNHESASSVEDSGKALANRIKEIVNTTGCEKVNIIAHSKGGLDCRYAISQLGIAPYVASLTTINTPHRGCLFVEYLLNVLPADVQKSVADTYNSSAVVLGDKQPDFLSAVNCLTESFCKEFNQNNPDMPQVYYQSIGSKLNKAVNGKFPLNFSYPLVKHFSGTNDGLVAEPSFRWGNNYKYLTVNGKRGISHADVIDLNRENINNFDVREFYVQLVADLKNKGF